MKLFEGKKLRPREHIRDWEDSVAEVVRYGKSKEKWCIIIDENFSGWYSEKEADEDFEET
jgi:hypothetical protein